MLGATKLKIGVYSLKVQVRVDALWSLLFIINLIDRGASCLTEEIMIQLITCTYGSMWVFARHLSLLWHHIEGIFELCVNIL